MEGNDNLEMGLFGDDIELNVEGTPEDVAAFLNEETPTEEETPVEEIETPPVEDINPNEEPEASEDVVEDEEDPQGGSDETSPNLISSFASHLHENGILPNVDLEKISVEDMDGLAAAMTAERDAQVKEYLIKKLGEKGYEALESGVSLAQYQQYTQSVETLDQITDEVLEQDLDLAKRVILQDYVNQGLSENRAKRILQKTIDLGDEAVLEDAKVSITSLKEFEARRLDAEKQQALHAAAEARKAQEKIDNDLKNAIYSKKAIIDGMEVNKTIQDRVYKAITEVVGEHEGIMENKLMRDRRENPVEFDAKLYYLYEITDGFKDFSKINAKAASKATSDFERALRQTKFEDGATPTFTVDKDSYDGFGSELVL